MAIEKVAVLGAGVMGAAIAAHVANAGLPVLLLDIVPEGAEDRSMIAKGSIEKMLKAEPAPFMSKRVAKLMTPGNLEDDLPKLAEIDWIIEAVIENPKIKSALYAKIDAVRKPGSIVSSNTSTIPLQYLIQGQSEAFKRDFLITHFFNPPRYMRLLELVAGPETRAGAVQEIAAFCDVRLGKGVVHAKDTPGFIANRIGTLWIQSGINAAMDLGLAVEEADALAGRPMGIPKTGIFGLTDLVGIDLMPHLATSLLKTLPEQDDYRRLHREIPLITSMIEQGLTGRKGKGGFYRLVRDGETKHKEVIDLVTGQYRAEQKPELAVLEVSKKGGLKALASLPDKYGQYVWAVLRDTLGYAASLIPAIADDIAAVDEAMRLGYNWKYGPFELIDQLGTAWFAERLAAEGRAIPELLATAKGRPFYRIENGQAEYLATTGEYRKLVRPEGVLLLADIKRSSKPLAKNASAALWDIGDGVVCLEFTSKMNTFDQQIFEMLQKALALIGDGKGAWKALVVYNEGENFSAGANLGLALFALNVGMYSAIEELVSVGQQTYKALKYAPFPVVSAPSGLALGGGCEILLHSDHVQAHAETYMGLVEVGVGLIPGWGGCKEMILRNLANKKRPGGPMPPVANAFETISMAKVSKSAMEGQELLYLKPTDGITMNRARLLADAKAAALRLALDYQPPAPPEIRLPGPAGKAALDLAVEGFHGAGKATDYDVVVSSAVADVLTGGATDITTVMREDDLLALERKHFLHLVRQDGTLNRIENMLETGKPLRN
jgi:3-hydroxyacyl-CoA dehydrogenase